MKDQAESKLDWILVYPLVVFVVWMLGFVVTFLVLRNTLLTLCWIAVATALLLITPPIFAKLVIDHYKN